MTTTICSMSRVPDETQFCRGVVGPGTAPPAASADTARDRTEPRTGRTSSRTTCRTTTRTTCGTSAGTTSRTSRGTTPRTACYSGRDTGRYKSADTRADASQHVTEDTSAGTSRRTSSDTSKDTIHVRVSGPAAVCVAEPRTVPVVPNCSGRPAVDAGEPGPGPGGLVSKPFGQADCLEPFAARDERGVVADAGGVVDGRQEPRAKLRASALDVLRHATALLCSVSFAEYTRMTLPRPCGCAARPSLLVCPPVL